MSRSLVADIGGTNARFAMVGSDSCLQQMAVFSCNDYDNIHAAILAYLSSIEISLAEVEKIALAIAATMDSERISMLNNSWCFSPAQLSASLGKPLWLINDFTAQALCLDHLGEHELHWLGEPRPTQPANRVVLGPGTGLGVAAIMADGDVLYTEGGHVGFAPATQHQTDLLQALWQRFDRVSLERIISGQGLENLYWANAQLQGVDRQLSAAEISAAAVAGDALASRSIEDLLAALATMAGDMALNFWAQGGVYLTGGVTQRLLEYIDARAFRAIFADKGRMRNFCERLPIAIITAPQPGLLGSAVALRNDAYRVA